MIVPYITGSFALPDSSFTIPVFRLSKSWTPVPAPSATTITICPFFCSCL